MEIKNYISKINDRNLQRKRESGLTTYALYSVLILIFYQIIQIYPTISFKTKFFENLIVVAYTLNIYIFIFFCVGVYGMTNGHPLSIRVISNNNKKFLFEQLFAWTALYLPPIATISSLIIIFINYNTLDGYFLAVSSLYSLVFFLILIGKFKKRNINETYKIFEGTGRQDTDKDLPTIILYLISLIIICFSCYYLFFHNLNGKLNIFTFTLLVFSFFIIIDRVFILRKSDSLTTALEDLEYEINIKELTDSEIRERLQKNYMGFLLSDWIIYNIQLVNDFKISVEKGKREIDLLSKRLEKIDKTNLLLEYKGRLKIVEDKKKKIKDEHTQFFNQKLNEVESIWKDPKIKGNDRSELSDFYSLLKKELDNKPS